MGAVAKWLMDAVMKRISALVCLVILATGCVASHSRAGVYPMRNQTAAEQQADLYECQKIASGHAGSMGAETATGAAIGVGTGAIIGATLGAIAGAFLGAAGTGAAFGAALGGATGGLSGTASAAGTNQRVYDVNLRACMLARGYTVGN